MAPKIAKRLVKLKVAYTHANGGGNFPGETVSLPVDVADRLVSMGQATYHNSIANPSYPPASAPSPASALARAPASKPYPGDLKGIAKMNWFKAEIRKAGLEPAGRTMAELEEQWRSIS